MIIFPSSSALIFTHFLFSIFYEGLNVFSIFFVFFSAGLEVTDCIPITVVICACLNFVEKLHNQIHITCPANSGARQTSGLGFSEPGTNSGPPHPPSQGCLRWRSPDKVHVINYYFSESIINYIYQRVYQYPWHPPLPSGTAFIPAEVRFPAALSGRVFEKRIFSLCFFWKYTFLRPGKRSGWAQKSRLTNALGQSFEVRPPSFLAPLAALETSSLCPRNSEFPAASFFSWLLVFFDLFLFISWFLVF